MQETSFYSGSVRVDLVGGTLDLEPINLILPNVVTLNVATSLKANVNLKKIDEPVIRIHSLDYDSHYEFSLTELSEQNLYFSDYFKEMSFVLQIIALFSTEQGIDIELSSGAPAGSGLGGSSAMGVTLYRALEKLFEIKELPAHKVVQKVKGVEGRILNQGIPGYQDYYPALVGGVLALRGKPGEIECEQLFSPDLKAYLEDHITLVYSGISRDSGINNWDVYKSFFDKKEIVRDGLSQIAKISHETYLAIKEDHFEKILELIGAEGESRKTLSPNIVPKEVESFYQSLKNDNLVKGLKMCGAGGGGCFIMTHEKESKKIILQRIAESSFKVLDFKITDPVQ